MRIDGQLEQVLIDTGCSVTLVSERAVRGREMNACYLSLQTMSDVVAIHKFVWLHSVEAADGSQFGAVKAYVMDYLPMSVDVVLGLDALLKVGLSLSFRDGKCNVAFGEGRVSEAAGFSGETSLIRQPTIRDPDYEATFRDGRWEVRWRWKDESVKLNTPSNYVPPEYAESVDKEIKEWLELGILVEHDMAVHGALQHYLPIIAVCQRKGENIKVRPVFDYRLLNKHIESHTGGATPLCASRIRQWRQLGSHCSILDLKRAYLQVRVAPDLWRFQAVSWQGKTYLVTRLGFGLSSAPKIMTQIVEYVLSVDNVIAANVSNYIDDLYVNEEGINCYKVREHLSRWGLEAKEPEKLGSPDGVRVLGLRVDHNLNWVRDGAIPLVKDGPMSRRDVHSFVGELLGHYPRAGWLRVACAFIQRTTAEEKIEWEEEVGGGTRALVEAVSRRLINEGDPVGGSWLVQAQAPMKVWVDASSLALGVVLEVEGDLVEDAAWLRPRDDSAHINRCELDAVIRGINLALRWGRRELEIVTDSQTVYFWLRSVINRTHNVKTKALDEVLIRRRLNTLRELIVEENISVRVTLVPSERNLADALTRVPKKWLLTKSLALAGEVSPVEHDDTPVSIEEVRRIHNTGHFGIERTHRLAVERYGNVAKKLVKQVVEQCDSCARFDPVRKNRWEKGQISASRAWDRWAIDVCHVGSKPYFTMIDVASGFTLWRELRNESGREIASVLRSIFCEFGPPESIMSDNGTAFRSRDVYQLFEYWEIGHLLTCAYRPQGNSVIERIHRTVKRTAIRGGKSIEEAMFWVNCTSGDEGPSPYEFLFCARSRKPGVSLHRIEVSRPTLPEIGRLNEYESCDKNPFVVGDRVYLRPPSGRCDEMWSGPHRITSINSAVSVIINDDGVVRHVSHLRAVPQIAAEDEDSYFRLESRSDGETEAGSATSQESGSDDTEEPGDREQEESNPEVAERRSTRTRRPPVWHSDYVM